MDTLWSDLKFAVRLLWKDKAFALTALLTLGICIGANTAIFSVVYSVLLRPLPVPESDRIVIMYNAYPKAGVERAATGVPDYFDRLRETTVFEEQALFNRRGQTVGTDDGAERIPAMAVTPSFFRLLRVPAHRGRVFTDEDGEVGADQKVILSHQLWQRLFHGDEAAIGKDLRVGGVPFTVVGVMPEDFRFLAGDIRLWVPIAFTPQQKSDDGRHSNNWTMIGRLKPGASLDQAQQQIDALNARNMERFPKFRQILTDAGFHTRSALLQDDIVRDIRGVLYLLWGGVGFVLLIGAVNITNLVLVRSNVRLKELATRQALGAARGRMARQLLTETMCLSVAGGALGLLLGRWAIDLLSGVGLDALPRGSEVAIDATVVAFVMALSVLVGGMVGVILVLQVYRLNLNAVLREEGRGGTSGRGARIVRRALVTAQVAIAFVLLIGAGLMLASFREVIRLRPGFDPAGVLTANVSLPATQYRGDPEIRTFVERTLERVRSLPGVQAAGLTSNVPFGGNYNDSVILAEGYPMKPGESLISPSQTRVSDGYFETMRIPLVRGRLFTRSDTSSSMPAIIVDERLAAKFWPGIDPLGRRMYQPGSPDKLLEPDPNEPMFTIVGVVGSVRQRGFLDPQDSVGAYYFPTTQSPSRGLTFAIRTAGDPQSVVGALRRELQAIDPELPVYGVETMDERMAVSLVRRRTPMVLAVGFSAVALFLSAIGIYGVLAYQVAQRTREIGIRMALGSNARGIFRMVLGEGLRMLAIGVVLGIGGAVALGQAMQSLLYGVKPTEPAVLALGAVVLGVVALLACVVPAARATRIDPSLALAAE